MVMVMNIPSWTPKTNLLLLCPFETPSNKCCVVQNNNFFFHQHCHGGLDIIDHAFGTEFPTSLLNELQGHGWIDDLDRGIVGRLKPARTKMDVELACVMHRLGGNISMVYENNGGTSNPSMEGNDSIRGDVSAFLPRHERLKSSFPTQYPYFHKLIGSIERTVVGNYNGKQIKSIESTSAPYTNNTIHFQIDTSLTSVQIAKYAGDGKAGYPRHCDRGAVCLHELSNSNNAQDSNGGSAMERILTFVYYLTPVDWDQELDGGALRMYSPVRNDDANDNSTDHDLYFDIVPYSDRLVVFRSDIMEHQVLPSLRRDRIAITVWLYGRVVHTVPITEEAQISSSPLFLQPSARDDSYLHPTFTLPPPLPVTTRTNTPSQEEKTIFVAIPSYRDNETWPTIKSLVEMALLPGRVYIGVVFQVDTASEEETKRFTTAVGSGVTINSSHWNRESYFRSIVMDFRHSTGKHCCCILHLILGVTT